MSTHELPGLRRRLDESRSRVRRMLPRALIVLLGLSLAGIVLTWVLEMAGAAAGIAAAVMLVMWVVSGVVVLAVVLVLVAAAAASGALKFADAVAQSNKRGGQ